MRKSRVGAVAVGILVLIGTLTKHVTAQNGNPVNTGSANEITLAVFADWPYSANLLNAAPLLINSINDDPKVRLVLHVGDIHSGSMPCTGAALGPKVTTVPATAVPGWNQGIFNLF